MPYEGKSLAAYFLKAPGNRPVPTVVLFDGMDNAKEMSIFFCGLEFARRCREDPALQSAYLVAVSGFGDPLPDHCYLLPGFWVSGELELTKKSLRELNHPLVILSPDTIQDFLNERLEPRFAPVVSGCHLGTPGITLTRGLEHRLGRSLIEARIIPLGEIESTARVSPLAGILIYESA